MNAVPTPTPAESSPSPSSNSLDPSLAARTGQTNSGWAVVSVLGSDRVCVSCGFNLIGQQVVREPHYGMLVARCPECSTVASLQEYPVLGRWARRWGALLAGGWVLALLVWGAITIVAFLSLSSQAVSDASAGFSTAIAVRYTSAVKAEVEELKKTDPGLTSNRARSVQFAATQTPDWFSSVETTWWNQQDPSALFAESGGWRGAIDWSTLTRLAGWTFVIAGMGVVWAVCLCHVRGRRLWLLPAGIGMVTLALSTLPDLRLALHFQPWLAWIQSGGWTQALVLATPIVSPYVMPVAVILLTLVLLIGVLIGRPIARGLVKLMLPPRLRGTLAFLWLCDGKPVPATGPVYLAPGVRAPAGVK